MRDVPNEPSEARKQRALDNLSKIEQLLEETGLACLDPVIKVVYCSAVQFDSIIIIGCTY